MMAEIAGVVIAGIGLAASSVQAKRQYDQQQEEQKQQQQAAPDTTAQEILDKEQRLRKERQILQRGPWQKVEKDW